MLNIVIPMAGAGSRFADAGYMTPKPMIPVHEKPMVQVVVENLTPSVDHRFIFVCQNRHIYDYELEYQLKPLARNVEIVGVEGLTEGQACSVLKAREFIDNDEPLMTANVDQYVDFDINDYLETMGRRDLDGLIMTMTANDPKFSYAKSDAEGMVIQTAVKEVISDHATVGIFNFRQGKDFVRAADEMIEADIRVNGEFYICPSYNYLIREGCKIGTYGIGEPYDGMYGLGIPTDLEYFLAHPVSAKIV